MITEGDKYHLVAGRRENGNFHLATEWYLRGWKPLPYQYAFHHVSQENVTFLGGIAVGKTIIATASCTIDCLTIPYFKVLNTSVTAKQSELAFDMFMAWYEGNDRLAHLVEDIKLRPWPIVLFKNFSEYEFRTMGKNARFIRGNEYDRVVVDEAGLDYDGEAIKVLRGRLRGTRPNGQKRMARMDVITSPTDSPWLRERFERGVRGSGKEELDFYYSMRVRTRMNTNLTENQIRLMEVEYTDEMIAVEMDAEFPDYGISMFPRKHITACTSQDINDLIYISMNPEEGDVVKGYLWEEHPRYGVTKYEMPYDPRGVYIIAGDPGMDNPPKRNAGCIGVLRIDVNPSVLVFFDWVFGNGSYMPFLTSYKYALKKYRPILRGFDSTSTQRGIQELAFDQMDIHTDSINFTRDKSYALNALSLDITNHEILWPNIKGIVRQISSYTEELDRKRYPQDIVMTLAMLSFLKQYAPGATKSGGEETQKLPRNQRTNRVARNRVRKKRK